MNPSSSEKNEGNLKTYQHDNVDTEPLGNVSSGKGMSEGYKIPFNRPKNGQAIETGEPSTASTSGSTSTGCRPRADAHVIRGLDGSGTDEYETDQEDMEEGEHSDSEGEPQQASQSQKISRKKRDRDDHHDGNVNNDEGRKRSRFDPCGEDKKNAKSLTRSQEEYVITHFTEFLNEETVKTKVLKDTPVPNNEIFQVPKLEADMLDLLPFQAREHVKKQDEALAKAQLRLSQVTGPLSAVWSELEEAVSGDSEEVDAARILENVEKSMLLLGQSWVWANYGRRLNYMSRLLSSQKRAHSVIKENGETLARNRKQLFGPEFYEALHTRAKGTQKAKEIRQGLTRKPFQPFRKAPSSARGGHDGGYGGRKPNYQGRTTWTSQAQDQQKKPYEAKKRWSGRGGRQKRYVRIAKTKPKSGLSANGARPQPITASNKPKGRLAIRTATASRSGGRAEKLENAPSATDGGPSRWQNKALHKELGKNYKRPSYIGSSEGLSVGVVKNPPKEDLMFLPKIFGGRNTSDRHRSSKNAGKTSNCGSHRPTGNSVHQPLIPQGKERRILQTGLQPKKFKQKHSLPALQNGDHIHAEKSDPTQRLDGEDRFEGRIFLRTRCHGNAAIPVLQVERENLQIPGGSLRLGPSAPVVHKTLESPNGPIETAGLPIDDFSGRLDITTSSSPDTERSSHLSGMAIASSGMANQLGKIHIGTVPSDGFLLGVHHRHPQDAVTTATKEGGSDPERVQKHVGADADLSERASGTDREIIGHDQCGIAGTVALSESANAEKHRLTDVRTNLWGKSNFNPGMPSRPEVVASEPSGLQRESNHLTQCEHYSNNRCIDKRVGGSPRRHEGDGTGPMDPARSQTSHKCVGAQNSIISTPSTSEGGKTVSYTLQDRQYDRSSPDKQNGGNQVPGSADSRERGVGTLPRTQNLADSRTSAGERQCGGRQSLQGLRGLQRLAVKPQSVCPNRDNDGSPESGFVRQPAQHTETSVCELETRSRGNELRCIRPELARGQRVCFPTILPGWAIVSQGGARQGEDNPSGTSLAKPTMVPNAAGNGSGRTHTVATIGGPINQCPGNSPPVDRESNNAVSSMESVGRSRRPPGFSDAAAELHKGGWRTGTEAAYNAAWKRWTGWSHRNEVDPLQATVGDIGNFLTTEFQEGKAYSTINGYRSAISARHPLVEGKPVGQHPDITKLMMGVFNKRPPVPRYSDTWAVDRVLEAIKSLGDNKDIDIKALTGKLAMLMALTSACRGSELSKIKLSNKTQEKDGIQFQLDLVTKTSRPGKALLKLTFATYEKDPRLDVVGCLEEYQNRTRLWRLSQQQIDFLFLGLIKPHKPVAPCTIARWLLFIMEKGNIDTSKYKAHSTRAASTSKASVQGMSVEQIIKKADWSRATTFGRFYHKDIHVMAGDTPPGETFQDKVLGNV